MCSLCAQWRVGADGELYGWGQHTHDILGADQTAGYNIVPVAMTNVLGDKLLGNSPAVHLTTGSDNAMAISGGESRVGPIMLVGL